MFSPELLNTIKLYLIALIIFFCIDILWLGLIAKQFYTDQIGFLMRKNINWHAALLFYLLFTAGLVIFVIKPAIAIHSLPQALLLGSFFGFVTYATYDLTNLATLKDWPFLITCVDIIWGTCLSGTISVIIYFIAKKLL